MPHLAYPAERSKDPDKVSERSRDQLLARADGFKLVLALVFTILVLRLYSLQFLMHDRYAQQARTNVERKVETDPVRGRIFDRDGKLLVSNEPFYRLVLDRSWGGKGSDGISSAEAKQAISRVARVLNWNAEKEQEILALVPDIYRGFVDEKRRSLNGYVILEDRLDFPSLVKIQEHHADLPGIRIEEGERRKFYESRLACHLLGYTGPISAKDYEARKDQGYKMTDWVGRDGLERAFDEILRGTRGISWQRRYANNLVQEEILEKQVAPTPGEDIYLSLDSGLQALAESILEGRKGGIAAVDPRDGQVLALASSPGFDLNLFRGGIQTRDWNVLLENPEKPLIDRSIGKGGGGYPPGSVFKIVTTIAGVEEGIITPQTSFHCSGGIQVGRQRKRCHKRSGHGTLDLFGGFRGSCDVYYYHLGERLGPELLAKYARGLGMGAPTGLPPDLHEEPGIVPDPAWKMRYSRYGTWGLGDTLNTAIGQGFLLATPLQIAILTAYVANGGDLLEPQLVSHRRNDKGDLIWRPGRVVRESIPVSPETVQLVQESMRQVVNELGGTARAARFKEFVVAGKTGTAEHYRKASDAWFCCYAPFESPEIALAIAIEEGGHGGVTSAPIAKELLTYFFRDRIEAAKEQVALP